MNQLLNSSTLLGPFALISPAHLARFEAKVERVIPNALAADPTHRIGDNPIHQLKRSDDGDGYETDIFGDKIPKPYMEGLSAVVPIKGVISSGLPKIFSIIGYTDTGEIEGWINDAAQDDLVSQIILDIDSPGGMVMGTPELADAVDRATAIKPVIAHTRGMMDSAAYWVASQATQIYCTPSADVGCIGVYSLHISVAKALADQGIDARLFKSGDLKATGHPAVQMSEAQAANVQAEIDAIGAQFRAAVNSKRTMVSDDSMRGQSFIGTEAAARNLVAGLRSFDSLLK